jgi:hypothetical protein
MNFWLGFCESHPGYSLGMFATEKKCAACAERFECGGLWFCWCRKVKLDAGVLQELRERYSGCLCPECLGTFLRHSEAESSPKGVAK